MTDNDQVAPRAAPQVLSQIDAQVDQSAYENIRPYFQRIMEQIVTAGRSVKDFVEFTIEKFGDTIIPYLKCFLAELQGGKIKLANLGESAWVAIFGHEVTPEKRLQMIQEAAYYRSQKRGPNGDSSRDWIEAESEVDTQLAEQIGLVGHGRKTVVTVASAVEKEFADVVESVSQWLNNHRPQGTAPH